MMRILLLLLFLLCHGLSFAEDQNSASRSSECQLTPKQSQLGLHACTQVLTTSEIDYLRARLGAHRENGQWVKVQLTANPVKSLLDVGIPDAYWIDVYALQGNTVKHLLALNEASVFADRPIVHRRLLVPIEVNPQALDLIVHYRTHGKTPLLMQLFVEHEFLQHDAAANLFNGLIFGLMIIVVPLLVLVFRSVHNSNYRIYAGLVLANLAFLAQIEGYGFQYLWPQSPVLNMRIPGVLAMLVTQWHIVFAIRFLQMRVRMLKLYLWHIGVFWLNTLILILQVLSGIDEIAMPAAIFYGMLAMVAAVRAIRLGIPAARFYLIGTALQVFFVVLMLIVSLTIANPISQISVLSYPKIGYLGEAIFFAAAVWSQIRLFNERQAELRLRRMAETEQLLVAEQAKLQALEKAKQQQMQLASASHDIAQPLASLRFALAALGQRPENKAVTDHVENTLNYAQTLLKDLIVQTREEQLGVDEHIEVHEILQQLLHEFGNAAQQKGLRLAIHDCRLSFNGSSVLLYRILSNLLSNAIRYTDKGRVVLGVRRRPHAIEFQVWDSGPGIPQHMKQQLLQAFARGSDSQMQSEGFGLGLYIVNSLCQQCGYQLNIISKPGKGSGFCLRVPLM